MHLVVDDLIQLDQLNTSAVKNCLRLRYQNDRFYTWAGPTLVALNPLREKSQLYSRDVARHFARRESSGSAEPHIFAVGQRALRHLQLRLGKEHQAIVVNGESGAGKTQSALHLLSYLAAMEKNNNEVDHSKHIEVLLCKSNPLLEAMGNAATLRNENSSRFGKLMKLAYLNEGTDAVLSSAYIETYLLESTRVARQADGERNFHIFYQMLSGLPSQLQDELQLSSASTWSIASRAHCLESDRAGFEKTLQALEQLGMEATIHSLWQLLAALLHLGNLDFFCEHREWRTIAFDHLRAAAQLLGLNESKLWRILTCRTLQAGANTVVQPCNTVSECGTRRDTLLKLLYRLAFDSVLHGVNQKLQNSTAAHKETRFLCILDLYGFESFDYGNSLEQLCINYANERLQHYFTMNYLKDQQVHLIEEGFNVAEMDFSVGYKENVIWLLDGPVSVFGVLNEECFLNRGCDDSTICQRIQTALSSPTRAAKNVPPSPRTPRTPRANRSGQVLEFTINHYAGPVTYSTLNMLDKNRDHVPVEFVKCLAKSSNTLVRSLANQELIASANSAKSGRKHTVLAKFKNSLDNLMRILNSCDVSYVRCIRPASGTGHESGRWNDDYVEAQLNACGVCDTIRVSSFGYPLRLSHDEFAKRYRVLSKSGLRHCADVVRTFRSILDSSDGSSREIHIGKTQVYATERGLEHLESRKNQVRRQAAVLLQRWWRIQRFKRNRAAIAIQRWWTRLRRDKAAARIQQWWRRRRSILQLRQRLQVAAKSIRVIKRSLKRWIFTRKLDKSIQSRVKVRPVALVPPMPPRTGPCVQPNPDKIPTCKPLWPGLTLQLPRATFFYRDGIISIRRPTEKPVWFKTRRTCLPFSHIVPNSMKPSGLVDALS